MRLVRHARPSDIGSLIDCMLSGFPPPYECDADGSRFRPNLAHSQPEKRALHAPERRRGLTGADRPDGSGEEGFV